MRIVIDKWDDKNYSADLVDIDEEDYKLGKGRTPEEAVARLLMQVLFEADKFKDRIDFEGLELDYN